MWNCYKLIKKKKQEFMIGATGAKTFTEAVRMTAEVFLCCRERTL
jgi:enolase